MNDLPTLIAHRRYVSALEQEDAVLAATIAAIRADQRAGLITDDEAVENTEAVKELHATHVKLLTGTYQKET
jgi:hypothetical protein